jgi:hypothetical protein
LLACPAGMDGAVAWRQKFRPTPALDRFPPMPSRAPLLPVSVRSL